MKLKISFLILILTGFVARATPDAISFYRQPRSPFSSGQASSEKLSKNLKNTEFVFDYLVQNQKKTFWATAQQVARDLDLSSQVTYQKQDYRKLSQRGYWAFLERTSDGHRQWAPVPDLAPQNQDQGVALTLIQTSLRKKPTWASELVESIPAQTALQIEKFEDSWILVKYKDTRAWVDMNNVLLKADFAAYALDSKEIWHKVLYREGFHFLLENKKTLALDQVKALRTDRSRGILIASMPEQNLFLRSQVHLKKIEAEIWGASDLPGHGLVYFKKSALQKQNKSLELKNSLTATQFLKREIFSISFDPLNPERGIASSHGIFQSSDGGVHWNPIPFFKTENHPVFMGPDNSIFVGTYRSLDQGQSFAQYLRPEDLTKIVMTQVRRPPQVLRLLSIEILNSQLRIQIEAGSKNLSLASRLNKDNVMSWDLLN